MSLPDQTPKLPKWPFLIIDVALLGIAAWTAAAATNRFAPLPFITIVGCVALAAIAFAIPFLTEYAHSQDAALDERQRSLESLARTVANSAEQISIAANGLNEIAELTQKSLRHADHLPQKLHEKVGEMKALLASVNDAEKEELEREVTALRATESDRLEATSDKIAKTTSEWVKLESATQKHLAAATASLDEKLSAALAALDAKISALDDAAKKVSTLPTPSALPAVVEPPPATAATDAPASPDVPTAIEAPAKPDLSAVSSAIGLATAEGSAKAEGAAHPPKRPRKPRRTEPSPDESTATAAESSSPPAPPSPPPEEPPPIPAEKIPEVAPIAPHTAEPFVAQAAPAPAAESPPPAPPPPVEPPPPAESSAELPAKTESTEPAAEAPKPPRKRAPKKPAPAPAESEPSLGLVEPPPAEPSAEVVERAVSSDGATRLLVTAYIGIGNRLFIRGDGPGLSWEKGVPLQFVSIGKWRWETANATAPVKFKLYKNDDIECTALGTQSLDPGQQQDVTAAF